MTNVRTILVPVDFSAESRAAIQHARDLARMFRSRLHLLHVLPLPSVPPWATDLGSTLQRLHDQDRVRARHALAAIIDEERLDPVKTGAVILTGRPADAIPLFADEIEADLIVMGLHSHTRLLGHVTERVMRAVRCPVLAIPERHRDAAGDAKRLEAELAC